MNLLVLLAGCLPWAATPVAAFTCIYLACSVLSLEVQAITWLGRGTLPGLLPLNGVVALAVAVWCSWHRHPRWGWIRTASHRLPLPVLGALCLIVAGLNLWRPIEAADPYVFDRVQQIEQTGTLTYGASLDPKANIVGGLYELILADLDSVPRVGSWLVRLHGVGGLLLLALAVASAQEWFPIGPLGVARTLPFLVPVVFNELIVIKNDLFVATAALVALAWAVGPPTMARPPTMALRHVVWAGWLAGLVSAAKLTNLAVALVVTASVALRTRRPSLVGAAGLGIGLGAVGAGVFVVLWQNAAMYGDPFAALQVEAMGNVNRSVSDAVTGFLRFVVSLGDLGVVTRQVWPGRGGWGGTFGLPLVWALVILGVAWRTRPHVRPAVIAGAIGLCAFGITFPDADVAHRLALGPALLLIVAAASVVRGWTTRWVQVSLWLVVSLASAQLLRSALLYAIRR